MISFFIDFFQSQLNGTNISHRTSIALVYILSFIITLVLFVIALLILIIHKKNHQIEFDNITGIPAYSNFERNVRKALKNAKANEYLILSLNIDNFRIINESYGVLCGNRILNRLGTHFMNHCRDGEFLCRFYADNFVFFMKSPDFFWNIEEQVFNMTNVDGIIRDLLPEKYNLTFTTSVYYIDDFELNIDAMIDNANLAQKLCKNDFATHRVIEYTKEMQKSHEWNRELMLTMDRAIENNEFEVFFQPKFNFSNDVVIGAEALVRWNNPREGFLYPDKFIPQFEDNGFIERIDKFVLVKVCRFLDSWNKNEKSGEKHPLTISFNLSRCHLFNPNLIAELKMISDSYDIGPHKIEVELTESVMFDNQKRLIKVMNDIKNAGFSVSVDDFGSGFSSLNMLKNMPADVIKLDKEFLSSAPENAKENIIISSVIDMAKKLNITTVAEGVETEKQRNMLKSAGCDIAQGFYYARPMPENSFLELLKNSASLGEKQ